MSIRLKLETEGHAFAKAYAAGLERDGGILITLGSAQVVYQWSKELSRPEQGIIRRVYPKAGTYRMLADCYGGNQILRTIKQLNLDGFGTFFKRAEAGFASEAALPTAKPGAGRISWSDKTASTAAKCSAVIEFLSDRLAGMIQCLSTWPMAEAGGRPLGATALNVNWDRPFRFDPPLPTAVLHE